MAGQQSHTRPSDQTPDHRRHSQGNGQWRHFNHHQDKKVYHVVKYRYWDGHGWSDWYKDVSHKTGLGH
ncbi:hypothetical protein, partial [Kocuria rhizophila]|uniref:hypothetical protein n=1 Tax=Kocuria rhizophila TaxID=72000 RepID=UPI001F1CD408